MGRQSSRIIWGKTKRKSEDSDYNLTAITDYNPNYIYTSGNIVVHNIDLPYSSQESNFHAYKCMQSEVGGAYEFFDTEEDWKELKGIVTLIPTGHHLPDSKAEEIMITSRYKFKPGAQVIKKNEDGFHYVYKCIEDTNVRLEGFLEEKWQMQYQNTGVGYMPRDHKDVYYNGKFHRAMYYYPDEPSKYNEEVTEYDGTESYSKDELCICKKYIIESQEYEYRLYKYIHNTPSEPDPDYPDPEYLWPPYYPSYWEEVPNVAFYEDFKEYKRGDMVINNYSSYADLPVTVFNSGVIYESPQMCLYKIKPESHRQPSEKDLEALVQSGDYTKEQAPQAQTPIYIPSSEYGKKIAANEEIYGLYEATETIDDIVFENAKWNLNYDVKHWDPDHSYEVGYTVGDIVIDSIPDSDTYGAYRCKKSNKMTVSGDTRITYQPSSDDKGYWQLIYQRHYQRPIYRVFKAIRDTTNNFDHNDWAIVTQERSEGLGLWGYIWRKLGYSKGGDPTYFPIFLEGRAKYSGNYHFIDSRMDYFYPYLGDNILNLGPTFRSGYVEKSGEQSELTGEAFNAVISTGVGLFAFSLYPYWAPLINHVSGSALWNPGSYMIIMPKAGYIEWKKYIIDKFMFAYDEPYRIGFYSTNIILMTRDRWVPSQETNSRGVWKYELVGDNAISTKIYTLGEHEYFEAAENNSIIKNYIPIGFQFVRFTEDLPEASLPDLNMYCKAINAIGDSFICYKIPSSIGDERLIHSDSSLYGAVNWYFYSHFKGMVREYQYGAFTVFETHSLVDAYTEHDFATTMLNGLNGYNTIVFTSITGQHLYVIHKYYGAYRKSSGSFGLSNLISMDVFLQSGIKQTYKITNIETSIPNPDNYDEDFNEQTSMVYYGSPEYYDWEFDVEDIGNNLLFYNDRYAYFLNDRCWSTNDHLLISKAAGIWELDLTSGSKKQLLGSNNPKRGLRELIEWSNIMDIPYYGAKACHLSYFDEDLTGLYLSFNYNTSLMFYAKRYDPDLELEENKIINGKLLLRLDLRATYNNPKCATGNGVPISSDDLVITSRINIKGSTHIFGTLDYTICIVLPKFKSTAWIGNGISEDYHTFKLSHGYDPRLHGAFFWLTSDAFPGDPFYGGPDNDAQGFSGW